MATEYQLYVVNNGPEPALDFCVYQTPPDVATPDVQSLAWLVKTAHPGTTLLFSWDITYSFLWAQSGTLKPGVVFVASQVAAADPASDLTNQITLDYTDGAYLFDPGPIPGIGAEVGTLYVAETGNIPPNDASVGIGMSGAGTFAVQAEPNSLAKFTPEPSYWLVADEFTQGEVVDIDVVSGKSAQVKFPDGVYVMTATLSGTNTWTVTPGAPA